MDILEESLTNNEPEKNVVCFFSVIILLLLQNYIIINLCALRICIFLEVKLYAVIVFHNV